MNESKTNQAGWRVRAVGGALAVGFGVVMATPVMAAITNLDDLAELDLVALAELQFNSSASLTLTDMRHAPVSLTLLGAQDIQYSGVRDLNHLLEIYVPNLQVINHHHHLAHVGFRGLISDREDKYLYQVNGRTLNNRMLTGADNERALPLLGDIYRVNVVSGSAAATHGAGALAGLINVETFTGLTFQGADLSVREGGVDEYSAVEARFGHQLADDSGVFLYYGLADQRGANSDYYLGESLPATNGLPANVAGEPANFSMPDYGAAGFSKLHHKLHFSYVNGPWEFWSRFVQDGYVNRQQREIYTSARPSTTALETWTTGRQFENQQFTSALDFKEDLAAAWRLEMRASYHFWAFTDARDGRSLVPVRAAREDVAHGRSVVIWTPIPAQSLALGVEYEYGWFFDPPQSDALDRAPVITQRRWQSDTLSFMAEEQLKLGSKWTVFLSARGDKHSYSDWLFSPHGTLVFTPTERDTFKLRGGESVRRSGDEELYAQHARLGTTPDPETMRSHELGYTRTLDQSRNWSVGGSIYHQDYQAIGWVSALSASLPIGDFETLGGELQLSYTNATTRVQLSHGVVKMLSSSTPLVLPSVQGISAQPYGYGNDLAAWSTHITKLSFTQDLTEQWTASTSLVYYWGFAGAKDYAQFIRDTGITPSNAPRSDAGNNLPYGPNLYWNLGLEYRPTKHWTFRVDGYNLAALFDEKISKRNYYFRTSEFSVEPASVAVSLRFTF